MEHKPADYSPAFFPVAGLIPIRQDRLSRSASLTTARSTNWETASPVASAASWAVFSASVGKLEPPGLGTLLGAVRLTYAVQNIVPQYCIGCLSLPGTIRLETFRLLFFDAASEACYIFPLIFGRSPFLRFRWCQYITPFSKKIIP